MTGPPPTRRRRTPRRPTLRERYGAGPGHFLLLIAGLVIAGIAIAGWFQRPREVVWVLEWFAAAILLHDLVAFPLYTLIDRIVLGSGRRRRAYAAPPGGVPRPRLAGRAGHIRVPALLSGLLALVFFPVILGLGANTELTATGIPEHGYLARWLVATAVMFALSSVAYGVRLARHRAPPARGGSG
jgi:hypothetical protein